MDIVLWTKKIAGHEWLPVDDRFEAWLKSSVERLPEKVGRPTRMALEGKSVKEIAQEIGFKGGTVSNYVSKGLMVLGALLGDDRSMFKSIREFKFSDEVDGYELGMCFYGRLTRNVQEQYLPRARSGELNLPMPEWKGGKWVWKKSDAEAWREWYVSQR